jgi:hypothetical protein
MLKLRRLFGVMAAVTVFAGCGQQEDVYDRAIKRLVAEQQQLDRIDQKIEANKQGTSIGSKGLPRT